MRLLQVLVILRPYPTLLFLRSCPSTLPGKDQDTSARAQIIQNITADVQPLVFDCIDAASTWKALLDEYESKNLDKISALRLEYDTTAYIEGTSLRAHFSRLDVLRSRLGAMGDGISDASHAMRLCRLLPSSWDGVTQICRAMKQDSRSVKERLLAEEIHRKSEQSMLGLSGLQHAFVASAMQQLKSGVPLENIRFSNQSSTSPFQSGPPLTLPNKVVKSPNSEILTYNAQTRNVRDLRGTPSKIAGPQEVAKRGRVPNVSAKPKQALLKTLA